MTLTQLKQRYAGKEFSGYGHYKVSFVVRGRLHSNVTTNMDAIERINMADEITDKTTYHRYTLKEAYQALYNEVMPPKSYNIKTTA